MVQHTRSLSAASRPADSTRHAVSDGSDPAAATFSELAEPLGMALPGMSIRIRLLEEAQLMTTETVGRVHRCMLAPYALEGISMWPRRLDRFARSSNV